MYLWFCPNSILLNGILSMSNDIFHLQRNVPIKTVKTFNTCELYKVLILLFYLFLVSVSIFTEGRKSCQFAITIFESNYHKLWHKADLCPGTPAYISPLPTFNFSRLFDIYCSFHLITAFLCWWCSEQKVRSIAKPQSLLYTAEMLHSVFLWR